MMKNIFGNMLNAAGVVIGWCAGKWLWEDVLQEKTIKLRANLSERFSKKES